MKFNRILNIAKRTVSTTIFATFLTSGLLANNANAQSIDDPLALKLASKVNMQIDAIADSPIPGVKQIFTERGIFYASDDGNYFIAGKLYNIENGVVDETEIAMQSLRLEGIEQFADSAIEFKAKNEQHVINVFTDATCGYCRKLHNEMGQLNDLGITVRYLAFPRAGIDSKVYRDAVSIWCAKNPQQAITDAKAGETVASASCENQVAEQYKFGQKTGVNGTPNIVLPNGSVIPGYQPAQAIAQALKDIS